MTTKCPIIHINGSDPVTMRDNLFEAAYALTEAKQKLMLCAPHMRDYYIHPDGNEQFDEAVAAIKADPLS